MTNYLLLRDNKQTGPYTFDELKEKGLKAYDLVWIEGKSAAWRYPCEVDELSAFAPMVEEQPFDRFYKKPSQLSKVHSSDSQPEIRSGNASVTPAARTSTSNNPPVAATILTGDGSSVPGKRIIYVTLPAARTAPAARERESKPVAPVAPVGVFEDNSAQYNEDWKSAVEITPRSGRKQRSSRLGQSLVVGLTVVALLAAGIFIGLSLNKDSLGFVKHLSLTEGRDKPAVVIAPPANHTSQPLAVNNIPPVTPAQGSVLRQDSLRPGAITETAPVSTHPAVNTKPTLRTASREKLLAGASKQPPSSAAATKDSSLLAVPVLHREATHRTDMTAEKVDKDIIRNNLSNLVSTSATGYTVGTFGGISGLQLTVSNHSIYALDLVVVEVQYIQANKKVFKTENMYFRGIAPGSALMQEAPKSSRGIKVQYKITLVNSKELGLSYSAL